ncbi:MAG: helix-turn-helix domain-containing protein, partial [Candidatus Sericytochromatia bacterium]
IYSIQKKDSSRLFLDKFIDLYEKEGEIEKKEIAASYNIIERKNLNQEIYNLKETKKNIYFITSILFLLLILVIIFSKKKYKNKIKNEVNKLMLEISSQKTNRKQVAINNENSIKILEGLKKLEKEKYFLSKNFNLHNVSKKIGTNTTYLSKIVQEHKNLSFNDYTNELRINFILNEFKTNKKLHNFTTQSLAEHIGYKNGDSFTKIFKEKTGVTPYKFIKEYKFENF